MRSISKVSIFTAISSSFGFDSDGFQATVQRDKKNFKNHTGEPTDCHDPSTCQLSVTRSEEDPTIPSFPDVAESWERKWLKFGGEWE
jgi:hypothetical protein